jgi:hypothetical protein
MARRYRACLDYLGVEHCGVDLGGFESGVIADCDGIIIATPTKNHVDMIKRYSLFTLPILCEKPISLNDFELPDHNIQMVNQYEHCGPFPGGETYYDCWRTGGDGLAWDCINIIGLAETLPHLGNKSPVWKCMINGKELSLNDVDNGYVKMLDAWTKNPKPNIEYIKKAHEKVRQYIETSCNRYPG